MIQYTVNPLYKDIRYNSTSVWSAQKSVDLNFFVDSPMLFCGKTYFVDIRPGDSNKYPQCMIYTKKKKNPLFMLYMGPNQVSL